jgi:hypothetical protein
MRLVTAIMALSFLGAGPSALAAQDSAAAPVKQEQKKVKKNPDVITHGELQTLTGVQTAYDAIQRLRPTFFNVRRSQTKQAGPAEASNFRVSDAPPMQLYVNGARVGGVDYLRGIPMAALWEVRKLNGTDASLRYGADHETGAILVTTGTPATTKP